MKVTTNSPTKKPLIERITTFSEPDIANPRTLKAGEPQPDHYISNKIRTARYTIFSWAPKSLLWQFRRSANIYFLFISVLYFMPFSPKLSWTMSSTFSVVLIFTMLKEAYEDYFRHKQDSEVNKMTVHIYDRNTKTIVDKTSEEIKVGDIVIVKENEFIEADLAFISSSFEKGLAFVNTMNLDGETNLKDKLALRSTRKFRLEKLEKLKIQINCEQPNENMHKWYCNLSVEDNLWEPIGLKQLLMRGCVLKNTEYAIGVAVYTGHETKIFLNSKEAPSKMSNVLKTMNKILYTVFAFQIFVCILYAGLNIDWRNRHEGDHNYIGYDDSVEGGDFFIQIFVFFITFSHIIPISLYITLEMVKIAQAFLISSDLNMYYEKEDKPAKVRSSDLVEELGQVEFIFSDKTGTLTCNEMKFRKCSVKGEIFEGTDLFNEKCLQDFFKTISLCHSVFPCKNKENIIHYQAPSPDEIALVEAAAEAGFKFFERTENTMEIFTPTGAEEWTVIAEVPFDSDRRRMSVIVKEPTTENLYLMTKGADTIMFDLINNETDESILDQHIYEFAVEGLRTLVVAKKQLNLEEFESWEVRWNEVELSHHPEKEEKLFELISELEKDLELVGISAIEDKLQEGVSETIDLLMKANIRIWVLTGDKEETAVEIGKSCNLITEEMRLIQLSSESEQDLMNKLNLLYEEFSIKSNTEFHSLENQKNELEKNIVIVINGLSLNWILENPDSTIKECFFKLGFISSSCICCRVTPIQKLKVVSLAKTYNKWVTLSIGDGANDVSMIQEAHIGVGIIGKEGSQAVQASDIALAQFRFLSTLLLVHGRWCYRRISWFICYYFYKNIILIFTELSFSFYNGFSGQIFFLDWIPMLYNTFFTSWPCLFTYTFEKDLDTEDSLRYPFLYAAGEKKKYFSFGVFWHWIVMAMFHGTAAFWVPILTCDENPIDRTGEDTGLWWISTLSFSIIIHIVTLKLYMESIYWTKLNIFFGGFSLVLYYLTLIVMNTKEMSHVFEPDLEELFYKIIGSAKAWICILGVPLMALLPDFVWNMIMSLWRPTPTEELMKNEKIRVYRRD